MLVLFIIPKAMESNVQLQLALDFVQYTDKNIFLTGKAGTGKTTFLHNLKKVTPKRMVVVAPTGVAAINAGGVTIHSFFQMPFGPHVPGMEHAGVGGSRDKSSFYNRFRKDKINLIRSLDLLVIDEISMVRADLLDGIDEVLKRYRNPSKPFGGIQLLMIGDLHQLAPVVKNDEWQILREYYPNLYFFSSRAYQQSAPVCIELNHIYRQSDPHFIGLLNAIRENRAGGQVLDMLNQRYVPGFDPDEKDGYITLTTHNHSADEINRHKLQGIDKKSRMFTATINDDFPEFSYPADVDLVLKEGAQVMFIKNDSSRDRLFYNGKIGKVSRFNGDSIYVRCPGDTNEIEVKRVEWQNIKYDLNAQTKEVEERVAGTFTQYPLKLAWAITIHKSQGLTFERAVIDANAAFAHGQVYVALSRCKSFEGLVLRSPIALSSIRTDSTVAGYTENANGDVPCEQQLLLSKTVFQQTQLFELFDFSAVKHAFYRCRKAAEENDSILAPQLADILNGIKGDAEKEIFTVADSFRKQLAKMLEENNLPEENAALQERVRKAASYFSGKTEMIFSSRLNKCAVETDNKTVKKMLDEYLERLRKEVFVKLNLMKCSSTGFNSLACIKARADAEIDFASAPAEKTRVAKAVPADIPHPDLYSVLKQWRNELAAEKRVPVYIVLPQKAMTGLLTQLPSTLEELELIKGIGKVKIREYGKDILTMINTYCEDYGVVRHSPQISRPQLKVKADTKKLSLDLFKSGRPVTEIAAERGLSISTIEGHLAHYVATGELDVTELVSKQKLDRISEYLLENRPATLSEAKAVFGDDVSYGELKAVMKYLEFREAELTD